MRGFSRQLIDLYRKSPVAGVIDMAPEQVVSHLTGPRGVQELRQWKAAILGDLGGDLSPEGTEAWDLARRHIFESLLGETTHGPGKAIEQGARGVSQSMINGRKLRAALNRMGDDVLNELLDPQQRRHLANISLVANALTKGGRTGAVPYTSITAQNAAIQSLISSIGTLGGVATGEPAAIAGGLVASLLIPPVIAKALVSPRAVEAFASPGFGRLAMEFSKRRLSREGVATLLRVISLVSEADDERAPEP